MKSRSLRFRLTVRFLIIFSIILLILGAFVYEEFNRSRSEEFDRSLYNYSVDAAHAINVDLFGKLSFDVDSLIGNGKSFPFAIGRSFVQVARLDGTIVGKSRDLGKLTLPVRPVMLQALAKDHFYFESIKPKELPTAIAPPNTGYRQLSLIVGSSSMSNFILQIAVPLTFLEQEQVRFGRGFAITIPLALFISLLGGFYLSRSTFLPIHLIIQKAKALDPTNLDQRLPIPNTNDELFALSTTLNNLLDRIQVVFVSQERFIADASHQLKTPLTILRGELELALKKPRSEDEIQELMTSMVQELGSLSRVIDNLLLLARVEGGAAFLTLSSARLDEITMEAVSRLEKIAREKNVTIKLDLDDQSGDGQTSFLVKGDEDLLKSLVSELLSNAIKYSPAQKSVEVKVMDVGSAVKVIFTDQGPGIPTSDGEKIFERFYRGHSLDKETPVEGSGLGLSIAKKIAEIHDGYLHYSKVEPSGACFILEIKKL